jgi:hypothetical protein
VKYGQVRNKKELDQGVRMEIRNNKEKREREREKKMDIFHVFLIAQLYLPCLSLKRPAHMHTHTHK